MKRWGGVIVAVTAVAACVPGSGSPTEPDPQPRSTVDLAALRDEAGIPSCPSADTKAHAVEGGLPAKSVACLGTNDRVNLAGLTGKPYVIVAWAQWCEPCRQEAPVISEVAASSHIGFIGLNTRDPRADLAIEFAGSSAWTFPQLQDVEGDTWPALRIPGLPTTLFVDANGVIVGRHPGPYASAEELRADVKKYFGHA